MINRNLILIAGKTSTGKSSSLRNLKDPEGVLYLGCESGKELPFKSTFIQHVVIDPYQVYEAFEYANKKDMHTIVIDSVTFLMSMFESIHVLPSTDGRKAWQNYGEFFRKLLQQYVASASQNVIMTAHTSSIYNEQEMDIETRVKLKGSIMDQGVEAFFTQVIASKVVAVRDLKNYKNDLLEITEEDELLGLKYCFQTRLTKETCKERIRAPMGLWSQQETFVDNDIQKVIDKTHTYFN